MDRVSDRAFEFSVVSATPLRDAALRALGAVFWTAADGLFLACVATDKAVRRVGAGTQHFLADVPGSLGVAAVRAGAFTVERRAPLTALAVILVGAGIGWNATAPAAVPGRHPLSATHAVPTKLVTAAVTIRTPRHRPPSAPAPAALQRELSELAASYDEPVGIAVSDVTEGWVASVDGQQAFPQQSVSKLWVAITAMDAVDQGRMRLDQGVLLTDDDRSVFFQPITYRIDKDGYQTTVDELLNKALITSDNAANDKLMGMVGGPVAVHEVLQRKDIEGVSLAEDEKHLQAHIAGMTWTPQFRPYGAFEEARGRLPREVRDKAMQAYLDAPYDGASPVGIVQALSALKRGELLSPGSTDVILGAMAKARTGPRRLAGGLPSGWKIAHKTGTGQDWRGATYGINDVGLLTAPDGRTYAVAVMMPKTHKPVPARLEFMQAVSRAVVGNWQAERRTVASLRGSEAVRGD
ncbi:serine hydrolase [Phenylobacterium aquaticum]|uniref:serine hydrolase n=1 Tax=Phenylobacterium aquaticum TaxID=1763816 RepID=UPI0026F29663|nr:serine hydrolase [Phenylobacterium aquaticum]